MARQVECPLSTPLHSLYSVCVLAIDNQMEQVTDLHCINQAQWHRLLLLAAQHKDPVVGQRQHPVRGLPNVFHSFAGHCKEAVEHFIICQLRLKPVTYAL